MGKARDTRGELMRTALDLMWSHNFGGVSVDEICRQAGAQKGSFYHFFESKSALALAALENLWEELRIQLDSVFSPHVPGLQRLQDYAAATLQMQESEAKKFGFIVGCPFTTVGSERCCEEDGITQKSWEILEKIRKYFTIALRDACEEGALKLEDVHGASREIFTHYLGANACARLSRSLEPMRDLYPRWRSILAGYERNLVNSPLSH